MYLDEFELGAGYDKGFCIFYGRITKSGDGAMNRFGNMSGNGYSKNIEEFKSFKYRI